MLSPTEIDTMNFQALRAQELARMSERSQQIWPLFISLASAFGFFATQSGSLALLVGLFPVLLCFVAQHVRSSEDTLKEIRAYLYQQEQRADHRQGYEHFTRSYVRSSHGGYLKALRGAFVVTQLLATASLLIHLLGQTVPVLTGVVALVEIAVIVVTWRRLTNRPRSQERARMSERKNSL